MRPTYQVSCGSMAEENGDDRRNEDRAPITLRVEYKRINTFFADYTKNISKGGTFIRTTRPLAIGTEFMFVLSVNATTSEERALQLELKGVVKWIVAEADATADLPAGMGIQFVFADDAEREAVQSVVAAMMNEALGPILAGKLLRGS
jgi:type IV pilus assembly protein PilZ